MERNKKIAIAAAVAIAVLIIGTCIGYNMRSERGEFGRMPFGRYDKNGPLGVNGAANSRFGAYGMHQMPNGQMMQNMMGAGANGYGSSSMAEMMQYMNAGLVGKSGDVFDQAFLDEMVMHHQGAVEMAKLVLATSKRPELIKLANDIITAQTKEINMMSGWRQTWFTK